MLIVVLFMITLTIADQCHGKLNEKPPLPEYQRTQVVPTYPSFTFPKRRDVPEALVDPYSVLGVLSFGVYIFYILYARYRMGMGNMQSPMGGGMGGGPPPSAGMMEPPSMAAPPPAAPALFNMGSEQNLAYLLEVASKILSNAAKAGENSFNNGTLLESLDYYEDTTDPSSK